MKYKEVAGLNLNGYQVYDTEIVVIKGVEHTLYSLFKGDYMNGFKDIRALFSDLEILTKLDMTDTKTYYNLDGGVAL